MELDTEHHDKSKHLAAANNAIENSRQPKSNRDHRQKPALAQYRKADQPYRGQNKIAPRPLFSKLICVHLIFHLWQKWWCLN